MEQITLTQKEFNKLLEYSFTIPTGTIIGKQWKKGVPYDNPTKWYLCEYIEHEDPNKVGILYKQIVAVVKIKRMKEKFEGLSLKAKEFCKANNYLTIESLEKLRKDMMLALNLDIGIEEEICSKWNLSEIIECYLKNKREKIEERYAGYIATRFKD
jgi:hypothetical protein